MPDPVFFEPAATLTLAEVAALVGAAVPARGEERVLGLAAVEKAKRGDLTFLENPQYGGELAKSQALACLVAAKNAARVPAHIVPLVSPIPIVPMHASPAHCSRRRFARPLPAVRRGCRRAPSSTLAPGWNRA